MTNTTRHINFPGNRKNKVVDLACKECHVIVKNVENWVGFPNSVRLRGVEIEIVPNSGADTPVDVNLKSLTHMVFSPQVKDEMEVEDAKGGTTDE